MEVENVCHEQNVTQILPVLIIPNFVYLNYLFITSKPRGQPKQNALNTEAHWISLTFCRIGMRVRENHFWNQTSSNKENDLVRFPNLDFTGTRFRWDSTLVANRTKWNATELTVNLLCFIATLGISPWGFTFFICKLLWKLLATSFMNHSGNYANVGVKIVHLQSPKRLVW